jgi:hypothetical protein
VSLTINQIQVSVAWLLRKKFTGSPTEVFAKLWVIFECQNFRLRTTFGMREPMPPVFRIRGPNCPDQPIGKKPRRSRLEPIS